MDNETLVRMLAYFHKYDMSGALPEEKPMRANFITALKAREMSDKLDPRDYDSDINIYMNQINDGIADSCSLGYYTAHVFFPHIDMPSPEQRDYIQSELAACGYSAYWLWNSDSIELEVGWGINV